MVVTDKTIQLISNLDSKLNKEAGYNANDLTSYLNILRLKGSVEVGWRSSCGKTDTTAKTYREWVKVVKALKAEGHVIEEETVKHGNGYATSKGGFWNSIIYSIKANP